MAYLRKKKMQETIVQCIYCYKTYEKDILGSHLIECIYRPVPCRGCLKKITLKDHQSHKCKTNSSCQQTYERKPEVLVQCRYCCNIYEEKILSSHENACRYQEVECPSCLEKIILLDYESHRCKTRNSCRKTNETPNVARKVLAGSADLEAENESESYANQSNKNDERISDNELKDLVCQKYVKGKENLDQRFSSVYSDQEGLSALVQNLENMLLKGGDHDVIFKVQEKEFKAHRNMLRARSPVFAAMFSHNMKENSDGTISIDDCEPDAFGDFLRYVYTARTENLTPARGVALYYAADKYDVPRLKETCAEFLKTSLTTTSVCDIISLAVKHDDSDLLERAATFFARHMEEVMVTAEWQRFIISNPIQASELCLKSVKAGYKKIDE